MRQIADQDGDALAEPLGITAMTVGQVMVARSCVHGRPTAAHRGLVHHVVVDQGEHVQQFERGAGGHHVDRTAAGIVIASTRGEPAGKAHAGPHPFAALEHHFPDHGRHIDVVDEIGNGTVLVVDGTPQNGQLVEYPLQQFLGRRHVLVEAVGCTLLREPDQDRR